jgi:hypothetical protein
LTNNLPVQIGSNFAASKSWTLTEWATVRLQNRARETREWQQERE